MNSSLIVKSLGIKGLTRNISYSRPLFKVVQYNLTDIGEGIHEVEVLNWFVKVGQHVNAFDKICEVASDKATVEITSRYSGTITKLYYDLGQQAKVHQPLVDIDVPDDGKETSTSKSTTKSQTPPPKSSTPPTPVPKASTPSVPTNNKVLTTPAVRRIAKEHSIDITSVPATGKDGRLLKEDMINFMSGNTQKAPVASPVVTPQEGDRVEPISGVRKVMFRTMTQANTIPTFTFGDEFEADSLIEIREKCKVALEGISKRTGQPTPSLSFMPFIIKAISTAIKQFPIVNSSISADGNSIIYKSNHNIGLAMDTPQGLVVPNIKGVQNKSIRQIANELTQLQELGKQNKLQPHHFSDGTLTISNIGVVGSLWATPVIFPPEVAIVAVGKLQKVPRFGSNNEVLAKNIIPMSWSADHRIIDGASMVRFSNEVIRLLQDPISMLMDL